MNNSSLNFRPYGASAGVPNIVVDGPPNNATVLTLTHWPGIDQPRGYGDDLSAQMAFRYLDDPIDHAPAQVVTNNHYDQDGLVGLFALLHPDEALEHRELLVDLAAAGDFATYTDRRAARASMTIWAMANSPVSPLADRLSGLDESAAGDLALTETLPHLLDIVLDNERYRPLWEEEDARLAASEKAISTGAVTITELPDDDLTIVEVDAELPDQPGHRFGAGAQHPGPLHPMALNNATRGFRQLVIHGRCFRYLDRYESWVQYVSRPVPRRVDLRTLADDLNFLDGRQVWRATGPHALTPQLSTVDDSALDPDTVVDRVLAHLRDAPAAWDPYAPDPARPTR